MGHRHTPEERHGARAVCGADGGSATTAAECVKTLPSNVPLFEAQGKHAVPSQKMGVRVALFALHFYKAYLSMLFAGSCRFEPTCSRYSYEAVERFGVLRGSWLTLKRLLRCQPLSRKFGFDPVPETWEDTPISSAAAGGGRSIGANEVHS
jgi:putative membrane protein insertion efficiency factor